MRGWRIGRIFGIDINVDLSWFLIAGLLVYSLGFLQFPRELSPFALRPRADVLSVTLGIATCLLLFASVLAHELAHSWMALEHKIPVKRITLFIFGGVAQIASEPDKPRGEFLVAIMGPLMSLALAAVFGAIWLWSRIIDSFGVSLTPITLVAGILAQANGSLALFNLAPGFPLDGGRVLRAILWGTTGSLRKATLWASRAGQFIAILLVLSSGVMYFTGLGMSGMWNVLIGLFLWNAATNGYRQTLMLDALRRISVADVMARDITTVAPEISIAEFVDVHLLHRRNQTFPVSDGVTFIGTISVDNIRRVPRAEWTSRRVRDAMQTIAPEHVLALSMTAVDALTRLTLSERSELPVIQDDQVIGFVGESELSRYLKLKAPNE